MVPIPGTALTADSTGNFLCFKAATEKAGPALRESERINNPSPQADETR